MVNKILLSLGLICLCSIFIFGQTPNQPQTFKKPDFSGTWIPKAEKEQTPDGDADDWTKVVIEQNEKAVKFTLIYPKESKAPNRTFNYLTDESGETNDGTVYFYFIANDKPAEKEVKSKTKWEGNVLVTVHKLVVPDALFTLSLDLIMRWELSADGKTLNRTMKYTNYKALYKQGNRFLELPVNTSKGNPDQDSQDSFVLLKTKK
jgi:hypothetical protein